MPLATTNQALLELQKRMADMRVNTAPVVAPPPVAAGVPTATTGVPITPEQSRINQAAASQRALQGFNWSAPGVTQALAKYGVGANDPRLNVADIADIRARTGQAAPGQERSLYGANALAARTNELAGMAPQHAFKAAIGSRYGGEVGAGGARIPVTATAAPVAGGGAYNQSGRVVQPGAGGATPIVPQRPVLPTAPAGGAGVPAVPTAPGQAPAAGLRGSLEQAMLNLVNNPADRSAEFESKLRGRLSGQEDAEKLRGQALREQAARMGLSGAGPLNTRLGEMEGQNRRERDAMISELTGQQMGAEVEDRFRGFDQAGQFVGMQSGEALQREGYAMQQKLAELQAKTQQGIASASERGALERLQSQLGFNREQMGAQNQQWLTEFGAGQNQQAWNRDFANRGYESDLAQQAVQNRQGQLNQLGGAGYSGSPQGAMGDYASMLFGLSGAHGATAQNQGGDMAGLGALLPYLLSGIGSRGNTPPYNPASGSGRVW